MDKRRLLTRVTLALIATGLSALSVIFIEALAPKNKYEMVFTFPVVPEGHPIILDIDGVPLIILRPSKEQWESIRTLDVHVAKKEYTSYRPDIGVFVYWGISTRRNGCDLLREKLPGPSLNTSTKTQWLGGYWDPICEVSYDYAGRAISSFEFTYNGFIGDYPNLKSPSIFKKNGNNLVVSRYWNPNNP